MLENQFSKSIIDLIEKAQNDYNKTKGNIKDLNKLPNTTDIPIEKSSDWLKIKDVICIFIDLKGSTKLSADTSPYRLAKVYQFFTDTITRIFHELDAKYIDIKGDGVFALYNNGDEHKALAVAVTIKTFIENIFLKDVKKKIGIDLGYHIGIDQNTLLVKKIGLKKHKDRSDRQNEVWAGKTVNMAVKLSSLSDKNIYVSDRFFKKLKLDKALKSCGCDGKVDLWKEISLNDSNFDFNEAYKLETNWCKKHGSEYFNELINYNKE